MDSERLQEGYRRVMRQIYAPRNYYRRVKTFLREYRQPSLTTKEMRGEDLWAFLRSCVRLGITGRERWQYWKLLLWTGLHRPELFSLAVTLAICGYHFRRTAEAHVR